ncbi:MAG: hypothetical protein LBG27_05250 [Spirochaetaceae bacterium]|jgi:hypothetical protein|nr:hypothetical protein [Spirochaetaceae bacterium]
MKKHILFGMIGLILVFGISLIECVTQKNAHNKENMPVEIKITVGDKVLTAKMLDNAIVTKFHFFFAYDVEAG